MIFYIDDFNTNVNLKYFTDKAFMLRKIFVFDTKILENKKHNIMKNSNICSKGHELLGRLRNEEQRRLDMLGGNRTQ